MTLSHSMARSGYFFMYSATFRRHSRSAASPRDTASRKCARTSSGTKKSGSFGQPSASLASATSTSPRGDPWASAVPCLFGLPNAIVVRTITSVGRASSENAASIAREIPSRSVFPSATVRTFHP